MFGGEAGASTKQYSNATGARQGAALSRVALRHGAVLLVATVVAASAGGAALALAQPRGYEATAEVAVVPGPGGPSGSGDVTGTQLARSRTVAGRTLERTGLGRFPPETLLDNSDAERHAGALALTVRASRPSAAVGLADAYAREYASAARRQGARLADVRLARRADRRQAQPLRGAGLGAAIGVLLALILLVLRETLDTRPRSSRQLGQRLRLKQLAAVPAPAPELERMHRLVTIESPGGPEAQAYRSAAERVLQAAAGADVRVLLLAGSARDDRASTVAANLGVEMTRYGRRVVLADLDTERPALRRRFALRRNGGLSAVLSGWQHLDRALHAVPIGHGAASCDDGEPADPAGSQGRLEVLTAGESPASMDRRSLSEILAALRERADLVLVISGPLLGDKRALTPAERCDALLLVLNLARARRSRRPRLERLLRGIDAPTLGFVLAGAPVEAAAADELAGADRALSASRG